MQNRKIREAQEEAYEAEKERIAEQYKAMGKSTEELMADYVKDDLYKQYLVHTAVITCDQATVDDFPLPNGHVVGLRDRNPRRKQDVLEVDENPVSSNGLYYATVRDAIECYNVPPFMCNCKRLHVSREELKNIMEDKERHKYGVCRHLMKLEKRWNNMPMAGEKYMTLTDTYPIDGDSTVDGESTVEFIEQESEGITMTSVLFCKQGGLIYPINSGQKWIIMEPEIVNVKAEILALLKEDNGVEKVKKYLEKIKAENPDYVTFVKLISQRESRGGDLSAVSGTHVGRYQLGDQALEQVGFKDGNGSWTEIANSLGVHNDKDFKESEIAQEIAMLFYVRWNYQYALTYKFDVHIGTTIEGKVGDNYYKADVTISGLIAAEHLVGQKDLIAGFSGKKPWGKIVDDNGTNALKYMDEMGGLDLTGVLGGIG